MKSLLVLSIAIALSTAACSSKPKVEEAAKPATPAVTAAAPAATTPAAPEKATAKKGKKSKKEKVAAAESADKATATASATGTLTCTKGSDVRTVEVKAKDNGCEVVYTKNGEAKSVASAVSGMSHCETVSQKISNNLSAAGMTCK